MKEKAVAVQAYQEWILEQSGAWGQFSQEEDGSFLLENDLAAATIRFYLDDLAEIMITMKADSAVKYYLHFQVHDMQEARKLFFEMVEAFEDIEERKNIRVLLCCTSGATTGYFASQLNEAAKTLNLNYEFDAAAYWRLYEAAVDFDVILMAPQIGYRFKKVRQSLPKKLVLMAPTVLFTANDSYKTLRFLDEQLEDFKHKRTEDTSGGVFLQNRPFENPSLLCLGIIYGSESVRTYYQVWDGDTIIAADSMKRPIKYGMVLSEVIESVLSRIHLDMICIAIPGVITEGRYWMDIFTHEIEDFKKQLEDKYHVPVWLINNANAAVLGLRQEYPDEPTIMFHSQPYGLPTGGQGFMIGDQLVEGRNGLSGEPTNFLNRMQFSNDPAILAKTDAGMLEVVTKALLPAICLLGPDLVALRSPMTNDMEEVVEKLQTLIHPNFIPKFVYIDDMPKYMLAGLKKRSALYLKDWKPKSRPSEA